MNSTTAVEARTVAMKALQSVSVDAIKHLRNVCEVGGMIGRHYPRCFYGQLAQGSGYPVELYVALDRSEDALKEVLAFGATIGVRLHRHGELDAIENFCYEVHARQTVRNSPELAQIAMWCDEELERRTETAEAINDLIDEKAAEAGDVIMFA
jgi:hypothetical protein